MRAHISRDELVNLERVQQLFSQTHIASLGSVSCALAVYFILGTSSNQPVWLNIWLLGILSVSLYRTILTQQFKKQNVAAKEALRWANQIIGIEWIAGLLWGFVTFGFVGMDFFQQIFIGIVLTGLVSGASVTFSPYFLAAIGFNVPSLTLLATSFLMFGNNDVYFALAAVTIVFSILMSLLAKNINHRIIQQINLRLDNSELAEELKHNNQKLQIGFREKEQALDQLKNIQNEIQSLNHLYSNMLENLPVGIVHLDQDLRVTFMNPEMNYILGVPEGSKSPSIGKIITEIPSIIEADLLDHLEILKQGKRTAVETEFVSQHGKRSYISVNLIPLISDEEFYGGLVLVQDVSSQVSARESILAAKKEAENANNAKSQFLANVSHELRTPLHGILGTATLLSETSLSTEQREYQEIIFRSATALLETVNQVLNLSRIEKGNIESQKESCDLASFLKTNFQTLVNQIEEKGLKFELFIDEDIPKHLLLETYHLQHILQNLIHNAFKFTDSGSISLLVKLLSQQQEINSIEFSVVDTGIGISEEGQSRIFDAFTQLDQGSQKRYTGTGLGMTITRQLIEHLGSKIHINSRPGEGSRFSFTLDLQKDSLEKPENIVEKTPVNGIHKILDILVVDDNAVNRMIAIKLLNKRGFHAVEASSGQQALELVQTRDFNVVLMDIDMPKMDGVETTKKIRQLGHEKLPIIAMTAHTMQGDKERFLAAGMDDYISKPYKHDSLCNLLLKHGA